MEQWIEIKKFPDYECSNYGNFRRKTMGKGTQVGKPRKTYKNPVTGYLNVTFSYRGEKQTRTFAAHRVIAENWIPNPNNLPQVNHKDKDRTNNHIDNLEWVTAIDNNKGLEVIAKELQSGKEIYFSSVTQAQKNLHISYYKIHQVLRGEISSWRGWTFTKFSVN